MKFHIISPTRLQVDVYDMNLQLNFVALFFVSQSCCYNQFFHQKTLFSNFVLSWKMRLRNVQVIIEGWYTVTRHWGCSDWWCGQRLWRQRLWMSLVHVSLVESLSKKVGRIKSCWKQELLFKWKTWHRVACVDFYSLCMDLLKISMYGLNKSSYKQAKLSEKAFKTTRQAQKVLWVVSRSLSLDLRILQ